MKNIKTVCEFHLVCFLILYTLAVINGKGKEQKEINFDQNQNYGLSELEDILEMIWFNALNSQMKKLRPKEWRGFLKNHIELSDRTRTGAQYKQIFLLMGIVDIVWGYDV